MNQQPTLTTERLILRPYTLQDAPDLQRLIGVREVAITMSYVPYPYPDGAAEEWINKHLERAEKGEFQFAITDRTDGHLIGGIGFHEFDRQSDCAEIGYWIAVPHWKNGYGTEAARVILKGDYPLKYSRRLEGELSE